MATAIHHLPSRIVNDLPDSFYEGVFALKWPEDTKKSPPIPIAVHLSVDRKGYYFICLNKVTKETECFDLGLIHDTRTGTQVVLPPDTSMCSCINIGVPDTSLASKWLTIYYGNTFVPTDLRSIHFAFESPNLAREWTEKLFRIGHNQRLRNLSTLDCLEKLHSKIVNTLRDPDRKIISVRSLVQFLCKNTRDLDKTQRICKALEYLALPNQMEAFIDIKEFTFNRFFRFYMHLVECQDVDKVFISIGGKDRRYVMEENFRIFLEKQNNPFNDAFKMEQYERKAKDLIRKYTEHDENFKEKGMSYESFRRYLLSFDNLIIDPKKLELFMDMDKPLAHYFISSSHNTYLTGSQIAGRSSIEMYRQALLSGCRCIELDVLESQNKDCEPEIKHKNTPVKPVPFIDVLVAIKEYAFKVTPYPLILSIENHCRARGQAKMAQYLVDLFGDSLIKEPLPTHPCEENYPLPSPRDLKYKILIKNNKLDPKPTSKTTKPTNERLPLASESSSGDQSTEAGTVPPSPTIPCYKPGQDRFDENQRDLAEKIASLNLPQSNKSRNPRCGIVIDDSESSEEAVPINDAQSSQLQSPDNESTRETKATKAMSHLVIYLVPTRFRSFEHARERNRSYEMSSYSEDRGYSIIREQAKEFLAYNQRQLTRIYPRGTRFDSSNYNPYIYWIVGCQMCALNYQTLDVPMQLNLGFFSFNNACGYIQKPAPLCQLKRSFDPKSRANIENVVGYQVYIKVISGQFLCQDREPSYVDIQMYGLYGDCNKRQETVHINSKRWDGFQAIYDDTDVSSNKYSAQYLNVTLPEMAALRFTVSSEDGTFIGQAFIPVAHLRPGYRYIVLRNQMNIPINASSLFVFIRINIHVDVEHQDFADRLVEPLMSQASNLINSTVPKQDPSNEIAFFDETMSSIPVRHHISFSTDQTSHLGIRRQSVSIDETNWYQKHLIAASKLHDSKNLCKLPSVNDIISKDSVKVDRNLQNRKRRVSYDYQKKLQREEERLTKYLEIHRDDTGLENRGPKQNETYKKDIELVKQTLIEVNSRKFHQQAEIEIDISHEYYAHIAKCIDDAYKKQLQKIDGILRVEISRVEDHVRSQVEREINDNQTSKKDRSKLILLREKSTQSNKKVGESIKRTLEDMSDQLKEILQKNLKINLIELEEKTHTEVQKILDKYSTQFNYIKLQLDRQTNCDEADVINGNSSFEHSPRKKTSASFSAASPQSPEAKDSNPLFRRRTIHQ